MKRLAALIFIPFFLAACGSDDENSPYTIDLELGAVTNGVAEVNVSVNSNDGSALPTSDIQLSPLMIMASGMEHGTPFESTAGTLNEEGEYTATAYFLMPSNMSNGDPMGDWFITVTYDGQEQEFPITVEMGTSDVKQLRGGDDDQIMSMSGGTSDRNYYIYNRGRHVNAEMSMNMFEVYIAARESMMDYQAIAEGNILNAGSMYELDIEGVVVEMCTMNCEDTDNWTMAMADQDHQGVYQGMDLGLAGDDSDMVSVRLTVNNEVKDNGATENPETSVMFTFDGSSDGGMMHH